MQLHLLSKCAYYVLALHILYSVESTTWLYLLLASPFASPLLPAPPPPSRQLNPLPLLRIGSLPFKYASFCVLYVQKQHY